MPASETQDLGQWLQMVEQLQSHEPFESRKQTHISVVLLGRDRVLKLKKPVDFGFLNYTTLARRREACEAEVRLNSRLCPDIYLGVQPIVRKNGVARLGDHGEAIDYGVLMKRLPADRMLDAMVRQGEATEAVIDRVVKRLSDFHRVARRGADVDRFGQLDQIRFNWEENFDQTAPFVGRTIGPESFARIRAWVELSLRRNRQRFADRVRQRHIVDGHGDARCESICVTDGICFFDCIEFNERFRCGDTAGEIAFLAMDLDTLGRPDLGYYAVERYITHSGDESLREVLPFYRCYRAYVRGKVHSFSLDEPEFSAVEKERAARIASNYFDWAERYATPLASPVLVVVSGLAGTGKTTLARAIASELGLVAISTDAVRNEVLGATKAPADFGEGAYTRATRNRVYGLVLEKAASALAHGNSVVLDGTFLDEAHMVEAHAVAMNRLADFRLIECVLAEDAVRERVKRRMARREGCSDANYEIHLRQKEMRAPQRINPFSLDTSGSIITVAREATDWLRGQPQVQPSQTESGQSV